jgi:hypothetical protein
LGVKGLKCWQVLLITKKRVSLQINTKTLFINDFDYSNAILNCSIDSSLMEQQMKYKKKATVLTAARYINHVNALISTM